MAVRRSEVISGNNPEQLLLNSDPAKLPGHVAIIMDGNGRWASARGLPRLAGHRAGGEAVRRIVRESAKIGLRCLTLYAFSTENWKLSRFEIRALMDLLMEYLRRELPSLKENNIRFKMIGAPEGLNISVLEQIRRAELSTFQNSGMKLNIALNYGSRYEIVRSARELAKLACSGQIKPEDIDEAMISAHLFTRELPDPDLVIRTSGEMRLSNFLLWQSAYAEFYVTGTLWPDFDEQQLAAALAAYQDRERRYGGLKPAGDGSDQSAINENAQGGAPAATQMGDFRP